MINLSQLDSMRMVDIERVDRDMLIDLNHIHIDANMPALDRYLKFLNDVQNPYAFKVGDVAVKVEYAREGKPLRAVFVDYLASLNGHI